MTLALTSRKYQGHLYISPGYVSCYLPIWVDEDNPKRILALAYMLPARNCGVNLGIRQLGIGLQRCFSEVIPQIQCGSI